jgi:tetratricopeptide (TPR) repeat protein
MGRFERQARGLNKSGLPPNRGDEMRNPLLRAISSGWRLFGAVVLVIGLSGCASKYETVTPEVQAQMMQDLQNGKLVLDCGEKCAFTWISKVDSIHAYDTAEQWPELAQLVMQIGYGQDLAYYYLGQSAQGLGYHEAAIKYYQFASALNEGQDSTLQCASLATQTHDPCQGVDLAGSIPVLIKASQDVLAEQAAAAHPVHKHHHASAATGSSGTSASKPVPSGWSLPPPAPDSTSESAPQ